MDGAVHYQSETRRASVAEKEVTVIGLTPVFEKEAGERAKQAVESCLYRIFEKYSSN